MLKVTKISHGAAFAALMLAAVATAGSAAAQRNEGARGGGGAAMGHQGMGHAGTAEPMRAPRGYTPLARPPETANRPRTMDRNDYRHNFNAPRKFGIGAYHPPRGYEYRRYHYGEILPPLFWGSDYILSDYWLFGLDLPPLGYEWVRFGPDALLIDDATGEVVQSVYSLFP